MAFLYRNANFDVITFLIHDNLEDEMMDLWEAITYFYTIIFYPTWYTPSVFKLLSMLMYFLHYL
jgi:hypothetical protein